MKHFIKRGTGVLLALALILSLLPAPALAEEISSSIPAAEAASGEVVQPEFVPEEEGTEAGESSDPAPEDVPEAEEDEAALSSEAAPETGEDAPETEETPLEPEESPASAAQAQAAASGLDQVTGDGIQYRVENGAATVTGYIGNDSSLTIPATLGGVPVTAVGDNAFKGHTGIEYIHLRDSVTSIGDFAFSGCKGLHTVNPLPAGLTRIGQYAFQDCTSLMAVEIPAGVTSWGDYAFIGCSALSSVALAEGLTTLGIGAFRNCEKLTSVSIPSTLQSTAAGGVGPFEGSGLREVQFAPGLTRISDALFRRCGNLRRITLPSAVTSIGTNAFYGCGALSSVTLPDGLTSIGNGAFTDCAALSSIKLPEGLKTVADNAFLRCTALRSVTLPASVTSVGRDSFRECSGLSSLTLQEGLTAIGTCAFRGCSSLRSVTIPASVTSWGIDAFQECSGLTSVTLSEGLTAIGMNAFRYCSALASVRIPASVTKWGGCDFQECSGLTSVTLGEGLATVGDSSFASCPNLKSILFEGRTTSFANTSFRGSPQVTLYCPYLSIATTRAIDLQLPFRSTDAGAQDSSLYALDYGKSGLFADINGMSANGCITVTMTYALRAQSTAVPSRLRVVLPANVLLDDESVLLDGAPLTGFTQDSSNSRLWYFPVTGSSGTLRLRVRAAGQGSLLGYAQLEMRQGSQTRQEVVGILNEQAQLLTLTMPELTGTAEFALSGIAPPAFPVTLSVDGVGFQKVTASLAGSWSARLILPSPSDNTIYTVTASCPGGTGSETLTQSRTLIYEESAPSLTGLELTYNQHGQMLHTDLMGGGTVKPKVYFQPRTEFRFDITFQNPGRVGRAYVTSTRNGEKKYLEARYDSASGKFVAQGFFDPNNPDYVPGKISVEYTPRRPEVNFTQEDLKAMVPNTGLREDQVSVTHPTEGGVTTTKAHFDLTGLAGELKDWAFDTTISVIDGTAGTGLEDIRDTLEKTGKAVSILRGEEKLDLVVAVTSLDEYEGYEGWTVLVHNVAENEYVKMTVDGIQGHTAEGTLVNRGASWLSDNLSAIGKITGMMDAQYKLDKEVEELEQEILSNTSLSAQQRKEALSKLRDYANDKGGFQIACVALPVLVASAGATGGGAALLVFSGILGAMNAASSLFWDYRVGLIKGESLSVNWVVDPSGYVYDLETGERLEGVTTTAYWISVKDDEELAESNKPGAEAEGTKWDASQYDQANPLTTEPDGRYQWDVPQGWWRVKYEKAGYVTAWSDWLPVPPPQTEVNVGMAPVNASSYVARLTGQSGSSAAIQVTRQAAGTGSLLFVAAAYDSSGRMTACRTAQWEMEEGGSASLSVPLTGQDATLRGFFLSPDSRAPLNRSWRVYLGQ